MQYRFPLSLSLVLITSRYLNCCNLLHLNSCVAESRQAYEKLVHKFKNFVSIILANFTILNNNKNSNVDINTGVYILIVILSMIKYINKKLCLNEKNKYNLQELRINTVILYYYISALSSELVKILCYYSCKYLHSLL